MRASIAWCVIPVPVSPVVAYRSPWSERRLRSLVSPPIRGFYGIRASSVVGVSWSFVRVFRRSLLPRSGLRSQSNPSVLFSIPRFLSFVPSRGLSRLFYGLCFVGFWDRSSPSIVSLPLSASGSLGFYHFFRSLWVFRPRSQCLSFVLLDLGSATVSCFVGLWNRSVSSILLPPRLDYGI